MRLDRVGVLDTPLPKRAGVRGIGVDTREDAAPDRIPVGPRGGVVRDPRRRTVDRIKVHRRLPCRQRRAVFGVDGDRLVRDLPDELAAPIPLIARRVQRVEGGVPNGHGHRRDPVEEWLPERTRLAQRVGLHLAGLCPRDAAHFAQVELLRERGPRWDRQ